MKSENMLYLYTTEYYSLIKKNGITDESRELEIIILNKVNKEKHFFFICGVSLEFLNVFVSFGIATDIRTLLRALGEEFSGREIENSGIYVLKVIMHRKAEIGLGRVKHSTIKETWRDR